MKESLITFTNRRLRDIWVSSPYETHERFMVALCFALYPFTLFMVWLFRPDEE